MNPRRLTTEDVASQLHVTPYTVRELTKARVLRGFKVGRRWLYDQQDVDDYVEAGQNRAPERRRRRRAA